jgi:hypothetical protein
VKVERDVDVVDEEDCTDMKVDEVYRPPVLSIKTEREVSILSNVFVVCVCIYVCFLCVCVCFVHVFVCAHACVYVCYCGFVLLDDFTCVRQPFLVHPGE